MIQKEMLNAEFKRQSKSKFGVAGWLRFCLYFANKGFEISIVKSKISCSRYINISKDKEVFTVRFSQHSNRGNYKGENRKPDLEIGGDGPTFSTQQAIKIATDFFEAQKTNS